MNYQRQKRTPSLERRLHTLKKEVRQPSKKKSSKSTALFFEKPATKKVAKTIGVVVAIFGTLYLSKYFLNATANMITSFKKVQDAWRS